MKPFFALIIISTLQSSFTSLINIDEVINALKTGNAAKVAKYFDDTVEIAIFNKSNSYNKTQAEQVLKDFFNVYSVKFFEILHKGENAGSQYCIGKLITKSGSFRTTIYMKNKAGSQLLQEIRIE